MRTMNISIYSSSGKLIGEGSPYKDIPMNVDGETELGYVQVMVGGEAITGEMGPHGKVMVNYPIVAPGDVLYFNNLEIVL